MTLAERAIAWPDQPAWHDARSGGIGASEIAAVAGLSSWATPLEIYLRKIGEAPPVDDNRAMRVGRRLEPIVLGEFCEDTGEEVAQYPCPLIAHPDYPFMLATPDADLVSGRLVEAKTAGSRSFAKWGTAKDPQIPREYLCQIQWQLYVAGRGQGYIACLIGGDDLRIHNVERNDRLIKGLSDAAEAFWERVVNRQPPEPDFAHPSTPGLLRGMYGEVASSEVITLSDKAANAWVMYEALGTQIKGLEADRDRYKAMVTAEIQNNQGGDLGDGRWVKKIEIPGSEFTVTRKPSVRFTACKVKKTKGEG